ATYYVTAAAGIASRPAPFTLKGGRIVFPTPPTTEQTVFVEYVHGSHADDYSSLAYQQTLGGGGGYNSILIDSGYTARHLGKHMAMGLDWLDDYPGLSAAGKAEVAGLLVRWADYVRDQGYQRNSPHSNYGAGMYVSRVFSGLVLAHQQHPQGGR